MKRLLKISKDYVTLMLKDGELSVAILNLSFTSWPAPGVASWKLELENELELETESWETSYELGAAS